MLALLAAPGARGGKSSRGGFLFRRNTWKWIAIAAAGAALLGWLLSTGMAAVVFDWQLALASFTRLRWEWIALSLIPIFGTYLGRALRWAVLIQPLKPHPSISHLLSATVLGFTAITLFGRPGEFVRPYLIARKECVPLTSQLAAWALERLFDLLMALLVFGFALSRVRTSGMQVGARLAWVLAAGGRIAGLAGLGVLLTLLGMRHFADPVRRRVLGALHHLPEKRYRRIEHLFNCVVEGVRSTRSDGAMIAVLLYSLLEWVLIGACYWCLARAFTGLINLSLIDVLILMGFISFGSVIQIPGVGGGIQVVGVLVLTELFGVRLELASTFALLLWFLMFVAIVPAGLLLGFKEGLGWSGLRRLEREASSE